MIFPVIPGNPLEREIMLFIGKPIERSKMISNSNPWESVGNGILVPRKGVCGRGRVEK